MAYKKEPCVKHGNINCDICGFNTETKAQRRMRDMIDRAERNWKLKFGKTFTLPKSNNKTNKN